MGHVAAHRAQDVEPLTPLPFSMQETREPLAEMMLPDQPEVPAEDRVWVDCFFYGFYIDKSKAATFQSSLNHHTARLQELSHR